MTHPVEDTIVARATAPGEAALALVRLSGPGSLEIARMCVRGRANPSPRHVHHAGFLDPADGRVLDDVVWWYGEAPGTYTGEQTVEITFHGSSYIVERAIAALIAAGARLAQPGEFTRRAFLNGRMSLGQAEAVADVIQSRTEAAHRYARERLEGGGGEELRDLRERLGDLVALLEAYLNFPDDVMDERDERLIDHALAAAAALAGDLLRRAVRRDPVFEGVRVALAGAPNVGKSSLFNRMVGYERALVSPVPGTTRDYLEADFVRDGWRFRLMDQAGWREGDLDDIERRGIELGRARSREADIVLLVTDVFREAVEDERRILMGLRGARVLVVGNKADLVVEPEPEERGGAPRIRVSCRTGEGFADLEAWLVEAAREIALPHGEQTLLYDDWRLEALGTVSRILERVAAARAEGLSLEFLSLELREGLAKLGMILGDLSTDEILDRIFSRFCIGK